MSLAFACRCGHVGWSSNKCSWDRRRTFASREELVVSTDADVVPPLPSDAAAADLGGSQGAGVTE